MAVYYCDETDPGQPFNVYAADGTTVAQLVAEGWTPTVRVIRSSSPDKLVATQSTNITLANTLPNLTRTQWSAATLAAIVADMATLGETIVEYYEHPQLTNGARKEGVLTGNPVRHTFKAVPA